MNKDRIDGAAKELKGSIKSAVGAVTGDAKLKAEGKSEHLAGKAQNALGGLKDSLKK